MDLVDKKGRRYHNVEVNPPGRRDQAVPLEDVMKDRTREEAVLTEWWLADWVKIRGRRDGQSRVRLIKRPDGPIRLNLQFLKINMIDVNGVHYRDVDVQVTPKHPRTTERPVPARGPLMG